MTRPKKRVKDALREAKLLFENYEAGDSKSAERIHVYFRQSVLVDPSLCRYVVARERGFDGWMDLVYKVTIEEMNYEAG